ILGWLANQGHLGSVTWEDLQLSENEQQSASELFGQDGAGGWILAWSHASELDLDRYIENEVVGSLGTWERELLGRLAVLPSFDRALAAAMVEMAAYETQELLERIRRSTPLVEATDNDGYRFSQT